MTQQTATHWWGTILEWVWCDGMARMLMTGVVPTTYLIDCELHFIGFVCEELLCDEWLIIRAAFGRSWQWTTTGETIKIAYSITNVLFSTILIILAIILIMISKVIKCKNLGGNRGDKQNSNWTHSIGGLVGFCYGIQTWAVQKHNW
jgi:hypothetical protein